MSESRIKQMMRIAQIFESVLSFNLRRFAILTVRELPLWRKLLSRKRGWVKRYLTGTGLRRVGK